mgnify:CR=1 FL=1
MAAKDVKFGRDARERIMSGVDIEPGAIWPAQELTAERLKELELVDTIIAEPLGGAHRDYDATAESLRGALQRSLDEVSQLDETALITQRRARLRSYGRFAEN